MKKELLHKLSRKEESENKEIKIKEKYKAIQAMQTRVETQTKNVKMLLGKKKKLIQWV